MTKRVLIVSVEGLNKLKNEVVRVDLLNIANNKKLSSFLKRKEKNLKLALVLTLFVNKNLFIFCLVKIS